MEESKTPLQPTQPYSPKPMPLEEPTEESLHKLRKEGVRPASVGCFMHDRKILFLYKKEHTLWQLPQGGIEEHEDPKKALETTMPEEMGAEFCATCDWPNIKVVHVDRVDFLPRKEYEKQVSVDGEHLDMLGKVYYFYLIPSTSPDIDITKTQFTDYFWLNYDASMFLTKKMYQPGKRRITMGVLEALKKSNLIA